MTIKKKYSLLGTILILSLFFCKNSPTTIIAFPFSDAGNDVVRVLNSIYQDEGDYHDEIDIVNIALVGTNIEIEFQDTPVIDGYHEYVMMIIWDEESSGNSTSIAAGNMLGQEPLNFVSTLLINSSGMPVAYSNIFLSPTDFLIIGFSPPMLRAFLVIEVDGLSRSALFMVGERCISASVALP